jgi:hypothetical protein
VRGYRLNTLLLRLADEPEGIDGSGLSAAERLAVEEEDIDRLLQLGANPYLLIRVFRHRFLPESHNGLVNG